MSTYPVLRCSSLCCTATPILRFSQVALMVIAVSDEGDIGRRIRELRETAGLAAQDAAASAGLSPSSWSRIESGDRAVKSSELARIADLLGVSPLAILEPDSLLARLPIAARSPDGTAVSGTVVERLTALAELDDVLTDGGLPGEANLEDVPDVDQVGAWLSSSDLLAAWARERFAPNQHEFAGPFHRLAFLIEAILNVDVLIEAHDSPLLGAAITDRAFPLIFLNAGQPTARAMFTLAHELGHVLAGTLDPLIVDTTLTAHGNPQERFANAFAASFLMPEQDVHDHIDKYGRGADSLAQMMLDFGVSFQSLVYRLHSLRIVNAQGRDRLHEVGWSGLFSRIDDPLRREEVAELRYQTISGAPPMILLWRAINGYRQGIISVRPLAGLVHQDPDELLAELNAASELDEDYSTADAATSDESHYEGSPI